MKHTKGPWAYRKTGYSISGMDGTESNQTFSVGEQSDMGFHMVSITRVKVSPKRDVEETEANAKLIASAPELLEALIRIKNVLIDSDNFDETTTKIYQLINKTIDPLYENS